MKKYESELDSLIFEIRYAYGHTYLDRCGQTLTDIERNCPGWVVGEVDPTSGTVNNPERNLTVRFNSTHFNFSAEIKEDRTQLDLGDFIREVDDLWTAVQANLGLSVIVRTGFRAQYSKHKQSLESARKAIAHYASSVGVPISLTEKGFAPHGSSFSVNLIRGEIHYRVQLAPVLKRNEMNLPASLSSSPVTLPKHLRQIQKRLFDQRAEKNRKHAYAVNLDVDCAEYDSNDLSIKEFVKEQFHVIQTDFLPILEAL